MKKFHEKWESIKDNLRERFGELVEMTDCIVSFTFQLSLETADGFKKELPERFWGFVPKDKDEDEL